MTDSPAIVAPAQETDAEFRRWVREEFRHVREMQKHTHDVLDVILAYMKTVEKNDEASHG